MEFIHTTNDIRDPEKQSGTITDSGALACDTCEFKGYSAKNKHIVMDETTSAVEFKLIPEIHNTHHHNFTIIDFTRKIILVGRSEYT